MQYALIKANKVENIIIAEPDFIQQIQADYDHIEPLDTLLEQGLGVGMGWSYENGTFIAPPQPEAQPIELGTKITQLAFLNRFTDAEAISIDLASIGATVEAAAMRRYMSKVNAAEFIDLDSQETRDGVLALEAATLLDVGRALIILDAPILEKEKFK